MDQAITIHPSDDLFNVVDPAQLAADLVSGSSTPMPRVQNDLLLQMLSEMRKEMKGMATRLQDIESQREPEDQREVRSTPTQETTTTWTKSTLSQTTLSTLET